MKPTPLLFAGVFALILILVIANSAYVVGEREQALIVQFGRPVGDPITEPGLQFKKPFIQKIMRFDKRLLSWDGRPYQIPTLDKKYILVDTIARWRISDPLEFFKSVRDERGAQNRLSNILDADTRDAITSQSLVEAVRNTNRELLFSEMTEAAGESTAFVQEETATVEVGRSKINRMIQDRAYKELLPFGIELVDFRIKRINYVADVEKRVFERMVSERQRIAQLYRSEGQGKSNEIRGEREKDIKKTLSEAYKLSEEVRGKADAEAAKIYAEAFGRDPEFYQFLTTMKIWQDSFDEGTTLMLSTDNELFRYLQTLESRTGS